MGCFSFFFFFQFTYVRIGEVGLEDKGQRPGDQAKGHTLQEVQQRQHQHVVAVLPRKLQQRGGHEPAREGEQIAAAMRGNIYEKKKKERKRERMRERWRERKNIHPCIGEPDILLLVIPGLVVAVHGNLRLAVPIHAARFSAARPFRRRPGGHLHPKP